MPLVTVTSNSQQVTEPDGSPALLANLDTAVTVYLGNSRSVSAYSTQLPPLGTLAVDGQRPWFAATASGKSADMQVIPGGTQWSPSPAQIAEQIALTGINVTVTGLTVVAPSGDTSGAKDSQAIQAALNNTPGNEILISAGTFYINTPLMMPSNITLRGAGRGSTIIQLADNVNIPALVSQDFASLTGSGSNTGGVRQFAIRDLTFDGNAANQTSPSSAAVQIFGYDYIIDNVDIIHFLATDGLYTEFGPGGLPGPAGAVETRFSRLRVMGNTLTGAGWRDRGPHDAHGYSIFVAFNSAGNAPWPATGYKAESLANVYGPGETLITQMHVYGNHGIGYDLADAVRFVNCVAEGASGSQVLVESADVQWIGGQIFPGGASAGAGIVLGTATTKSTGYIFDAVEILNFAGTAASNAAINFVNSGPGRLAALIYQPTGQAIWGTANDQAVTSVSYSQTDAPAVAAGPALGGSPPPPTTLSWASDLKGTILMGTGTAPAAGSAATVTFAQPKASAHPIIAISPLNAATALLAPYVASASATGFTVGFANAPAAGQGAGTYQLGYAHVSG